LSLNNFFSVATGWTGFTLYQYSNWLNLKPISVMHLQIMGLSGSPVKNSNTDRLIQAVLESSGLSSAFVKLSKINVRPCLKSGRHGSLGTSEGHRQSEVHGFADLERHAR
jgi:hypothetical protein